MPLAALAALLGVGWVQLQPGLVSWPAFGIAWAAMLPILAISIWGLRHHAAFATLRTACGLLMFSVACAMLATWMAQSALAQRLPDELDRASVWMEAVVLDLPTRHERGWRMEVQALSARRAREDATPITEFPMRGVLHWYANEGAFIPDDIRPGDRWRFQVRLRPPTGPLNPGGFDTEAWMLEKGLQFTATVQQGRGVPRPEWQGRRDDWQDRLARARDEIRRSINDKLAERDSRHVLAALVVGDQRAIAASSWRVFQRTGVSHLMSISGLHVTMLAALAGWLGMLSWKLVCRTSVRVGMLLPVQSVGALAAMSGAIGYALLAGWAIPAQRTALMVTVLSVSRIIGIRANPWAVIALALLVIILTDPMAVLAPGFWLSFIAVAFLFSLACADDHRHAWPWHQRMMAMLRGAVHAQLGITLALMPLVVMLFQQVSVVGPLANAIAIPVVSYLVTPLAMMGVAESMASGSGLALHAADVVQSKLYDFLSWAAQLKWSVVDWPAPGIVSTAMATAGMTVALGEVTQGRARRWRHLGWLGMCFVLGSSPAAPSFGEMRVHVVDVGQGSAIVIRTHGHTMLFDVGPAMGESDAGERMVLPALRRMGVRDIDALVVSHFDRDHSGGLASVLSSMNVHQLIAPFDEEVRLQLTGHRYLDDGGAVSECRAGEQWEWDGVRFVVLHPSTPKGGRDRNRDSCVVRVEDRHGGSILLTGDIPLKSERAMVAQFTRLFDPEHDTPALIGAKLASDVLVAPHHGSRTSTGMDLLAGVAPSLVVVQAGYRNRFGHPHAEVLERIETAKATTLPAIAVARTDLQGALDIRWEQGRPVVQDFFADHRRYWHAARNP